MKILKFEKISSTNLKAKELAEKGTNPWTVIVAKEQIAGYGRKKTYWFSPRGGLYFSIVLPKIKFENVQLLTILAVLAVAKVLKECFALEPLIKLPNDLILISKANSQLIKPKKIAGILIENVVSANEIKSSVLGIGLNTNIEKFPEDLENTATSLKIELGQKVDNNQILRQIIKELKENLKPIY